MTAQPLEAFRLGFFLVIALLVTLISQGFGMIVGAAFGVKVRLNVSIFFLPRFSTPLNERVINFKLIFAAGCCSGAVRYCAFRRILWIFLTFGGRTKMASLAIPCIIFEICHRGCDTCHFWL